MKQLITGIFLMLIIAGCDPENTITTTPKSITGKVTDNTLGAATLEAYIFNEQGDDIAKVGEGTLKADGSFNITLEEPKPADLLAYATVSQGFKICDDGVISDEKFKAAPVTLYVVKDGARIKSLTQTGSNGNKIAYYIYINQDVEGDGTCSWMIPTQLENAKLKKGWNQVLLDFSSGSSMTITTPAVINLPWN